MRKAIQMPPEGRTAGLWEQPAPYVLPHSVEMSFVRSMECPFCHSHLLMNDAPPKSPEKVYCPVCGWKPRDVKKTAAKNWEHEPGVWYHVTTEDRLPLIRQEGLRPDTDAPRFEHKYSAGIYLFGMPEQAYNWYRPEEWDAPLVMLRITGIPEDQVQPDPEMVNDYPPGEWEQMLQGNEPYWQYEQVIYSGTIPPQQIEWHPHSFSNENDDTWQKLAHGYGDDFRTLLGMMKHAYQNEEFGELLQLATRMQITADEMIPQAHEEQSFMNDSVPGHRDLTNWIYPQDSASWQDMIDKHVKLQYGQFGLPGNIKQQAGFIEQAIINGDLKGFKAEMLQQYIQSALKQFHETGKWQGVWKVLKNEGGEWEQMMDDPQKSMNVIDTLFELEMSKSDPIYKKLQNAVHKAEDCGTYLQWIESYLDEADGHFQDYLTLRAPWQEQFDAHQKQLQEFHDKWNTPGNSLEDVARELGIDLDTYSKTAAHVELEFKELPQYLTETGWSDFGMAQHLSPTAITAFKDDQPVGSVVYFTIDNPQMLQMIPGYEGDPYEPVMWVEWIYVDPEYRDTDAFAQLALKVKEAANGIPIKAYFQNEQLQRVVERYLQRAAGANGPLPEGLQIQEVDPGRFKAFINGESIGEIQIDKQHQIHVNVRPQYQRRGIATELLRQLQMTYPEFVPSHSTLISEDGLNWAQQAPNTMWPSEPQSVIPAGSNDWYYYEHGKGKIPQEAYDCPHCGSDYSSPTSVRSVRQCNDCGKRFVPDQFQYQASFDMPPLENPVSYEWTPWTDQELSQWHGLNDDEKAVWRRRSRNLTRGARRRGYAGSVAGRDLWLLNNRYRGNCAYCGGPGADSWDHVKPLSQGGEHIPSNILPAHLQCNYELGAWDDRNRDYRGPSQYTIQNKPLWTMQPAEAKISKLGGFRVWSDKIHDMAEQKRKEVRAQIQKWADEGEASDPRYVRFAFALINGIPDQGYKLIPWVGREIVKNNLFSLQNWGHANDIIYQAAGWFDWAREHNKPLPEFNRKDFGFHELEQWVYEMNSQEGEGDEWTDSQQVYSWEDGWSIDKVGPNDLAREGELMGHCVGGYCDQVTRGNTSIYSLRDPKGQPHVTLEIEGNPTLQDRSYNERDISPDLRVIQVQGKSDTEPIPEYRRYVDEWFDHLRGLGYEITEEEPDREPEMDWVEHGEGPMHLNDPEDYLDYHKIMHDQSDRLYNFGEDEDPEIQDNTWTYYLPRVLHMPTDPRTMADQALKFIKSWEAGQYTNDEAIKYVQAMWLALHHSTDDSQRGVASPDWQGWDSDELRKQANQFWDKTIDYLREELLVAHPKKPMPGAPQLFNPNDYNEAQISPQAKSFIDLMDKLAFAPHEWTEPLMQNKTDENGNNVYRNTETGEEGRLHDIGYPNQIIKEPSFYENGEPRMQTKRLDFPGSGYGYWSDYGEYFRNQGLNEFPTPAATASWVPLEAHQSAPNGTRVHTWALTSGWPWEKQEAPSVSEWDVGQSNEIPEGTNVHDPNLCPTCGREKNPGSDFCPYCYAPYDQAPDPEAQKAFGWHPSQYPLHIPQAWMQTIRDRDMPPSRQNEYVKQWKEPYNSYWTRQTMATPQMIEWLRSQVPPDKKEKFESDLAHFTDRDGQMWGVQRTKGQLDLYDWMWLQRMYGPMDHYGYPKQQAAPPQVFQGKLAWKRIEPSEELRNIAHGYMANQGWGDYDPPQDYPDVDPARAKRIADEYERMEHDPHNPQVRAAYDALMQETQKQYEHLLKHGYQMEFEPQEGAYNSPWDAIDDVRNNKHLYVYPTTAGFGSTEEGDHPLLEDTGYVWNGQPVTYNDLFRGVHDVFGHAKEGVGFRQDGEENAWRQHAAMYSDLARHALTSETRGQNSWVNYGPYGEQNQTADQSSTVYAPQKAGLMADWTAYEGDGRE
jgi:hypothetical protein